MSTPIPAKIFIYHIVHIDRLASIAALGGLYSDAHVREMNMAGSTIGMHKIKVRRMRKELTSQPGLFVGMCVPFPPIL